MGISWTEYARLAAEAGSAVTAYTAQGAVLSVAPGMLVESTTEELLKAELATLN